MFPCVFDSKKCVCVCVYVCVFMCLSVCMRACVCVRAHASWEGGFSYDPFFLPFCFFLSSSSFSFSSGLKVMKM
jgi:hypothetical protein